MGERHGRWRGGKTVTSRGYIRLTAGSHRGMYEHRLVASKLWEARYGEPLPRGYEVHHIDFDPAHNCPANLLILGPGLHIRAHLDGWRRNGAGQFAKKEEPPW
jgi:hypothetical protein